MQLNDTPVSLRLLAATLVLMLGGCAVTPRYPAPVESRSVGQAAPSKPAAPASAAATAPTAPDAKPLPGAENAGKPGYYTVKPGDTLIRIALDNGQNWRDLVKWNTLDKPNQIEVGQVLRVLPPSVDAGAASTRPIASSRVEARPLDAKAPVAAPSSAPALASAAASALGGARDGGEDEPSWAWPSSGAVTAGFDELRNKGLAFAGKAGDPVLAAADGRVMYAGSGLRGYGNMVIIKHNATYLTAYAHNQTLLVKEDQVVRKGQKIAEMGSSDADQVKLHFEVRKQGKPVDPAKLLPAR